MNSLNTSYFNLNDNRYMVNVYSTGLTVLRVWNGSGWQTAYNLKDITK